MTDAEEPGESTAADGLLPQVALLQASQASIGIAGAPVLSGLTFELSGPHGLLLGAVTGLWSALSGAPAGDLDSKPAKLLSGDILLLGRSVARREHFGLCGYVEPSMLLARKRLGDCFLWFAELGCAARGEAPSAAIARAQEAHRLSGIGGGSARPSASLNNVEQRIASIAASRALGSEVLLLQRPLAGLDREAALLVLGAIDRLSADRRTLSWVSRLHDPDVGASLVARASTVAAFGEGGLLFAGELSDRFRGGPLFRLVVRSNESQLLEALSAQGDEIRGARGVYTLAPAPGRGVGDVLRNAKAVRAAVVEIAPLM